MIITLVAGQLLSGFIDPAADELESLWPAGLLQSGLLSLSLKITL
jgi:hypothetical protein